MRKTLKDIRMLASLLLAGAALLSCSGDDETPASTPETPETPKTCTMTVLATKAADTRALTDAGTTLTSTWTAGDVVTVWSSDGTTKQYGTLTAQSSGASTTLTGTLTSTPSNNQQLLLKYLSNSYDTQDGTLTGTDNSIDKVCDYSTATVTATVTEDGSGKHVTTTDANFANQQAIVKFTLTDGTNAINATSLTVSDGTNDITLSNISTDIYATTKNGAGVLYVALPGFSGRTVSLTAATSNKNYRYSKESITFTNSNFYRIAVTMNEYVPGLLDGKFSVNGSGKQVSFSQGNLRATYDGSAWTWAFATNQWDYIGDAAGNTSINGNGTVKASNVTVDLFGWVGASSTWTGVAQYGITSSTATNATNGYGNVATESLKSDWGTLAISNGGKTANSGWRTLTADEWVYLFNSRSTTSGICYAKATVNGVKGVILLPDDWNSTYYSLTSTNTATADFATNNITESYWSNSLAAHGAVFLPAAGYRYGTSVYSAGTLGGYWSSTPHASNASSAYNVDFNSGGLNSQNNVDRSYGLSVRLVREVQ